MTPARALLPLGGARPPARGLDDVRRFMTQLARRPTPRPREVHRRALLRRARIASHLRLRRRRAAYCVAPALAMEVATYVTLWIATTHWVRAHWLALRDAAMYKPPSGGELPLSLSTALLLLLVAVVGALASPRVRP